MTRTPATTAPDLHQHLDPRPRTWDADMDKGVLCVNGVTFTDRRMPGEWRGVNRYGSLVVASFGSDGWTATCEAEDGETTRFYEPGRGRTALWRVLRRATS
jgi:hypothetical protein